MKRSILAAVALLSLAACGDDLDGVVVQKNFEPGYVKTIPVTSCGSKGCSTGIATDSRPDCYRLVVKTDDGEVETHCVEEARWAMAEVGERYVGKDVEQP